MEFMSKLKHAWNAFTNWDQSYQQTQGYASGASFSIRPDRVRVNFANERSIISSIYNRISLDAASIPIKHIRNDSEGRFLEVIPSTLNDCLTVSANVDQAGQQFRHDMIMTLLDKGVMAVVPIETSNDPTNSNAYDILNMRVGEVVGWYPEHVRVNVYNQQRGLRQQITLPKTLVSIVENPFYQVMNEPSSTLQRLIRKLNMLDAVDEASSSGKLDLIIQLPYVVKSESRKAQAEQRRKDIEFQLKGSQYGIAYTDGTEKITQLNRPAENNLLAEIQYLTEMLYSQLGITDAIMNGTADEATMNNYQHRTIEPILRAVVEAMRATFLTKTARTQGQSIMYFRDMFAFVPMADIAAIADKFSRNEILSANDFRQIIGYAPSKDPNANKLRNSNMPIQTQPPAPGLPPAPTKQLQPSQQLQLTRTGGNSQNGT